MGEEIWNKGPNGSLIRLADRQSTDTRMAGSRRRAHRHPEEPKPVADDDHRRPKTKRNETSPTTKSVAPWIDFDDYKAFERITNDLGLEKDLLHFRGKIVILSRFDSEASRARTEDVQSIGGNFNIFRSVFCKKIRFLFFKSTPWVDSWLKEWMTR